MRITEKRVRYKRSLMNRYGDDTSSVAISEVTTANSNDMNTVHGQLQILQHLISEVETEICAGESFIPPSSIMGRHN